MMRMILKNKPSQQHQQPLMFKKTQNLHRILKNHNNLKILTIKLNPDKKENTRTKELKSREIQVMVKPNNNNREDSKIIIEIPDSAENNKNSNQNILRRRDQNSIHSVTILLLLMMMTMRKKSNNKSIPNNNKNNNQLRSSKKKSQKRLNLKNPPLSRRKRENQKK